MSQKIIRIEHKFGEGLWRAENENRKTVIEKHPNHDFIYQTHCDKNKFPTFYEDKELRKKFFEKFKNDNNIYDILVTYFFAFKNIDQLKDALSTTDLKYCLKNLDFKVLLLEVKDFIESPFQIIFKKEDIINSEDISFMFL